VKPFFQFRLWLRRGPATERVLVAASALVAIGLFAWVSVPADSRGSVSLGSSTGSAAAPTTGGNQGTGGGGPARQGGTRTGGLATTGTTGGPAGTTGRSASGGAAGTTTGTIGTTGATGPTRRSCPTSSAVGVTPTTITVAVILLDLGTLNSFVGIPSVADQEKVYNAVINGYNAKGGVGCRKLVPRYYSDNPLDASGEQATCLQIVQDKVYATLNNLGGSQVLTCLPQHKVPGVWYTPPTTAVMHQFAPYIVSHMPDYDRLIKDYVAGVQRYHFFDGMKKIGILEESCVDDENKAIARELAAAGIPSAKITTYNYGCPTAVSSPDQDQAAALQFQRQGVTHVMNTAYTYITNFASAAEKQNYKPKYSLMEDGAMAAIAYVRPAPVASFDQALAITTDQVGAENTKGLKDTPATAECSRLMKSLNEPTPTTPGAEAGALFGGACAVTKLLVAAHSHHTDISQRGLPAGLAQAGKLDLSYPPGPMHVTDPSVPTGGQWYRGARWYSSCTCWRVIDPTFHPGA
jgi:hypothetical protein